MSHQFFSSLMKWPLLSVQVVLLWGAQVCWQHRHGVGKLSPVSGEAPPAKFLSPLLCPKGTEQIGPSLELRDLEGQMERFRWAAEVPGVRLRLRTPCPMLELVDCAVLCGCGVPLY